MPVETVLWCPIEAAHASKGECQINVAAETEAIPAPRFWRM